jgi:hypothetical protein
VVATISSAHTLAAQLLAPLPDQWAHVQAVARHAQEIAPVVGLDYDIFLCTAWLLDIGYSPDLERTGWHRLDGALYLRDNGWPVRIAALVAHHCKAALLAPAWGLTGQLAQFAPEEGVVADALIHVDLTAARNGARTSLRDRLDDLERPQPQDGAGLIAARALRRQPLLDAVARTEHQLQALGRTHGMG